MYSFKNLNKIDIFIEQNVFLRHLYLSGNQVTLPLYLNVMRNMN